MDDDQTTPPQGPLPACLTQGLDAPAARMPALPDLPQSIQDMLTQMLAGGRPSVDDGEEPDDLRQALNLLAALGVERVEFCLEGGGDEGTASTSQVVYRDGRTEEEIPPLPVGFGPSGEIQTVAEILEEHAAEAPDFNWVDNEGGSGTVAYLPLDPVGERVEIDMAYHDEEYDEGEDEDEHDLDDGDEDDDAVIIGGDE